MDKTTTIQEYQDRCVAYQVKLSEYAEAIDLIHDEMHTGGSGSETAVSIARRAVDRHARLLARCKRLEGELADLIEKWDRWENRCIAMKRADWNAARDAIKVD